VPIANRNPRTVDRLDPRADAAAIDLSQRRAAAWGCHSIPAFRLGSRDKREITHNNTKCPEPVPAFFGNDSRFHGKPQMCLNEASGKGYSASVQPAARRETAFFEQLPARSRAQCRSINKPGTRPAIERKKAV
jgi:hypothetical protein